jgi:hypothetical protein
MGQPCLFISRCENAYSPDWLTEKAGYKADGAESTTTSIIRDSACGQHLGGEFRYGHPCYAEYLVRR